jgi:hypothetical protein
MANRLDTLISKYTEEIGKNGFKKDKLVKVLKLFPELSMPNFTESKFISSFEQIIIQSIKFNDLKNPKSIFKSQNMSIGNFKLFFLFYMIIDYDKFEILDANQIIEESGYASDKKFRNLPERIVMLFLENESISKELRLWLELQ